MGPLGKLVEVIAIAIAFAHIPAATATPFPDHSKHATHRLHEVGQGLKIEAFHPPSTYESFGVGIDHPLSKRADPDLEEMAIAFVESRLGMSKDNISFKSGFSNDVAKHAYVRQSHGGIPFANAVANIAFNRDNKVVSFGSSFVNFTKIASSTPSITLQQAIIKAEGLINGKHLLSNVNPPTLEYLVLKDGSASLTHVVQIRNDREMGPLVWVKAFIDAHSGDLISITDFVNRASYRAVPITKQDPVGAFVTITDLQDLIASPNGWHDDGNTSTTITAGNNAISQASLSLLTATAASQTSPGLNFVYTYNFNAPVTTLTNRNAATVNAFYIVNRIHDIAYRYGFTEAAFNFQQSNFGKGGAGNDHVKVIVQSLLGVNNANFATPAESVLALLRNSLFLWTLTTLPRDGAIENDIIVHEYTHGITNRMTGGGTASCLQTTEAGGMGEGWSDALADWTEQTSSTVLDFTLGAFVTNDPAGIRSHPYSTDPTTNPLRYSSVATQNEVRNIGEVWSNMLHNVYAALVTEHGFTADAFTNPGGSGGNVVFMHLFIDALALQPCNPTFVNARDAWIQADVNRYNGANSCIVWGAFASRGLGVGAANFVDSSVVPSGC
ncbi:hypothetical protein ONZ45_g3480 [Pleurotus djamor]|nr:hypothetical protein ONZ45_g3480 [Pleurotus djamor]